MRGVYFCTNKVVSVFIFWTQFYCVFSQKPHGIFYRVDSVRIQAHPEILSSRWWEDFVEEGDTTFLTSCYPIYTRLHFFPKYNMVFSGVDTLLHKWDLWSRYVNQTEGSLYLNRLFSQDTLLYIVQCGNQKQSSFNDFITLQFEDGSFLGDVYDNEIKFFSGGRQYDIREESPFPKSLKIDSILFKIEFPNGPKTYIIPVTLPYCPSYYIRLQYLPTELGVMFAQDLPSNSSLNVDFPKIKMLSRRKLILFHHSKTYLFKKVSFIEENYLRYVRKNKRLRQAILEHKIAKYYFLDNLYFPSRGIKWQKTQYRL